MNLNWSKYEIDVSKLSGGKGYCPKCHDSRKHKRDRSLSVDTKTGLFNCHNCSWSGSAIEKPKKEYVKPPARLEKLNAGFIKWFEDRSISNNTLLRHGITEAKEWMPQHEKEVNCICFNYYVGEDLVNIKFRGPQKAFKMVKDAELIFYNLNAIQGSKTATIVEGEVDCLSLYESGIYDGVSVPNGASKGSMKLEYLDNCWQHFEGVERIVLCVDNDEPGMALREELARRLGKERCAVVTYPDGCKDANEVLQTFGKDGLKAMVENATDWPLEGIVGMEEMYETVSEYYLNGYPQGAKAQIDGFDDHLSFVPGQLTMITGIPGSGKDEFANLIMVNLAKHEGWSWAICGFEEPPQIHVTKLIEKFEGRSFAFRKDQDQRITDAQFQHGVGMVDKYFSFIDIDKIEVTMDGILNKAKELVKKKGIKGLVINPWNYIEHNLAGGQSETLYVSECLTKLVAFLTKYGVHGFLIAHPTKINKDKNTKKYEVPTLYSISGSAHFFNKTHNGICIYRDFETNQVDVYVQKVKWSWLGKIGFCSFNFNTYTRQYEPIN